MKDVLHPELYPVQFLHTHTPHTPTPHLWILRSYFLFDWQAHVQVSYPVWGQVLFVPPLAFSFMYDWLKLQSSNLVYISSLIGMQTLMYHYMTLRDISQFIVAVILFAPMLALSSISD